MIKGKKGALPAFLAAGGLLIFIFIAFFSAKNAPNLLNDVPDLYWYFGIGIVALYLFNRVRK